MDSEKLSSAIEILQREGIISLADSVTTYVFRDYAIWKDTVIRHVRNMYAYDTPADPYKIVFVSPCEITKYTLTFGKHESISLIESGDWDLNADSLSEYPKYTAIQNRYLSDIPWTETGIYEYMLSRIETKGAVDGCVNKEELKDRYEKIDELYESLRSEGYDSSHDSEPPSWWWFRDIDYIAVHVGRNGELIFAGSGCHRLAIADLLGIDQIPVWIRARHEQWQRIRDEIDRAASTDSLREELKNHLNHPDLQDVVSVHSGRTRENSCVRRQS